jgi:sphingomyelin phosphodiesterase 2
MATAAAGAAVRLRVATLNTWGLPEPAAWAVAPRMRALSARLPALELDVLALQEVWTAEARALLVEAGRRAGLPYAWQRTGVARDGGLLVLSRLPILGARFERYTLPGRPRRPDYFAGKGFLQLRLAGDAGPVQIFDTHLHARYASEVPHAYEAYRVGQIVQLATALRETHEPAIAAGDFNLRDDTAEYRILTGLTGLRDVAAELGRREPTVYDAHPLRATQRDRRIDYLLVRDGQGLAVRARRVERAFDEIFEIAGKPASYSDHAGVVAELELAPGAGQRSAPEPEVLELASSMLARGRALARRQRREDRALAGVGLGGALAALAGVRAPRVTRRRLLRASLHGAALLALAPGLGYSLLSEVCAPDELRCFDDLAARLASWRDSGAWIA